MNNGENLSAESLGFRQAPYITVHLSGLLAEQFEPQYRLRAWTTYEALEGLSVIVPEFGEAIAQHPGRYNLLAEHSGELVSSEELLTPVDILLVPALDGQGNTGRAILGAALIVVGFYTGGATTAAGISLLGGAILNMLSPKNKKKNSDDELKSSTIFEERGTAQDGDAVPEACGGPIKVEMLRLNEAIAISDVG